MSKGCSKHFLIPIIVNIVNRLVSLVYMIFYRIKNIVPGESYCILKYGFTSCDACLNFDRDLFKIKNGTALHFSSKESVTLQCSSVNKSRGLKLLKMVSSTKYSSKFKGN